MSHGYFDSNGTLVRSFHRGQRMGSSYQFIWFARRVCGPLIHNGRKPR